MDYAQYVSRRPPSPPSLHNRHHPITVSPSLSSTSTISRESPQNPSRYAHHSPAPIRTTAAVSAQLHRRALRDEYTALAAVVASAVDAEHHRHRQEAVRIRLEDMLTHADSRALRVLNLALDKCNVKLDALTSSSRTIDDARTRMRVIESKHFHGARAATVPPELRAMHIRREALATLVEHIQCALHDQVRIHFLLQELAAKLKVLSSLLYSLDRPHRVPSGLSDRAQTPPATPPPRHAYHIHSRRQPINRRPSRSAFRTHSQDRVVSEDRTPVRGDSLRSQRSLPRRHEGRRIPFVVKRALSYNASAPVERKTSATVAETSWWSDADSPPIRSGSEPRLNLTSFRKRTDSHATEVTDSSRDSTLEQDASSKDDRQENGRESDEGYGASPASCCTAGSENSPTSPARQARREQSIMDQSILLDIDSLCTEASSVLSSSRGMESEKPSRRGSLSSSLFRAVEPTKRPKGLARLRFGRMRVTSQIKKLWSEINEVYGIILTHGPHLVEEKIVSASSMESGILGPCTAPRKGRGGRHQVSFQTGIVSEAIRRTDNIVLWQQRLIVAIRRDHMEQRKSLRHADHLISQAYLQSLKGNEDMTRASVGC